jgi:hypothetical protein
MGIAGAGGGPPAERVPYVTGLRWLCENFSEKFPLEETAMAEFDRRQALIELGSLLRREAARGAAYYDGGGPDDADDQVADAAEDGAESAAELESDKLDKPRQSRPVTIASDFLAYVRYLHDPYGIVTEGDEDTGTRESLHQLQVMERLDPTRKERLVAIVWAFKIDGGSVKDLTANPLRTEWAADGADHIQGLHKRMDTARAAIADVLDYIEGLGMYVLSDDLLQEAMFVLDSAPMDEVEGSIAAFNSRRLGNARVVLCNFFHQECGLPPDECEIRTGVIGNAFFGWNVDIQYEDTPEKRRGCEAVAKAYRRVLRPRQLTWTRAGVVKMKGARE